MLLSQQNRVRKMTTHVDTLALLMESFEELRPSVTSLPPGPPKPEARLFGRDGLLDSLALVQLIVAYEEKLFERTGRALTLTDDRAFAQERSPFRTPATLAAYVSELLAESSR